jgi:hypothetical protein
MSVIIVNPFAVAAAVAPNQPGSITVYAGDAAALVAWTDSSSNETGFELERYDIDNGWSLVASPAANAVSFEEFSLTNNTTYYYRVRAVGEAGNSSWTTSSSFTPQAGASFLGTPQDFSGGTTFSDASLSWSAVQWATSYSLESSTDNNTFTGVTETSSTNATHSGLTSNTTYYYRVKANRSGHNSGDWALLTLTTQSPP